MTWKSLLIAVVGVVVALLIGSCGWWLLRCPEGQVTYCNYEKIQSGMTLEEVNALLGKGGEQIEASQVAQSPSVPVVHGDQFYQWKGDVGGRYVQVGMLHGKVHEKFWFEWSL